ncbi:MAG: hypothetical protein ACFFFK_02865 [Candidatus Thorarchaeota archaeon]
MTESPVKTGSFFNYQVLIFIVVFIWSIIGFEVAQFQLLPLYETLLPWIAWSLFTLISIIPAITAVTWRMKTRVVYIEPEWNFREREVSLKEYETMIKQYRSEYRNYLSYIDFRLVLLACILSIIAVTFPIILIRTTFLLIAATPILFGLTVLFYGLVCSSIIFKLIPNEATSHFPIIPMKTISPSVLKLQRAAGISWTGVRMNLGEASGFYTIRNVLPLSRIEGIESVATLRAKIDDDGEVSKIESILMLDESSSPIVVGEVDASASTRLITELVEKTLNVYIKAKGEDELLDEVLEDITHFLKQ